MNFRAHFSNMKSLVPTLLVLALCGALIPSDAAESMDRPNFVVILADDLGFSDLGCYGSEIETPTLDRLAAGGLRFTQFYNTAKCHSSRVSLLSGRWCRQAGDESLSNAVILPEILQPAGYFTAMAGKWHLSKEPTDFGFQRYFGHLSGATNYYRGDKTFRLNGEPWEVPGEGFYTTVANVDHALGFLEEARAEKKPWFLYLAFNAPHAPLQPLREDYARMLGRYEGGWDQMREARLEKQRELGLFGKEVAPSPRPDHLPAWDSLTPEIRDWESRRMSAYAALIHRVDREIGRLVADLEAKGELENTLILFVSDNGACPYDRRSVNQDGDPCDGTTAWSDSTGWAWARNSPFRYYKQNQFEGGIATPAILHWPAGIRAKAGSLVHEPAHLVDVLPTLVEVAGATIPDQFPGRTPSPLAGVSLKPMLEGGSLGQRPPIHFLFSSDRALRDGAWKLVSFQSEPWELYRIDEDRTELHDLAAEHPGQVEAMAKQWHEMAEKVLHATAKETAPVAAVAKGQVHREWSDYSGSRGAVTSSRDGDGEGKAKGKKGKAKQGDPAGGIRARVGTNLKIAGDTLVLKGTGEDPGLAFDQIAVDRPGPYRLRFDLQSDASGEGELFFTTDPETKLPDGKRVPFAVKHDGSWQEVSLPLETTETIHGLRLDVGSGAGAARIRGLALVDMEGKVLVGWP
jgi:arylsulfatase